MIEQTKIQPKNNSRSIPLEYTWSTPEDKTKSQLRKYLCVLGSKSNGKACASCESQCAFGRSYIKE